MWKLTSSWYQFWDSSHKHSSKGFYPRLLSTHQCVSQVSHMGRWREVGICKFVSVSVCVCVWDREGRERETISVCECVYICECVCERKRDNQCVCVWVFVCVHVCVREGEIISVCQYVCVFQHGKRGSLEKSDKQVVKSSFMIVGSKKRRRE